MLRAARGGGDVVPRWLTVLALLLSGATAGFAQSQAATSSQTTTYGVAGLTLGSRVLFDSAEYHEYSCSPSDQFDGFTLCRRTREERDRRRPFTTVYSILHSHDGTVVYVNRYQEPAFFDVDEANEDIQRYSRRIGESPRIEKMPRRPGFRFGVLATWGKVILEPLDDDSIAKLAAGRSPRKGYLIDFIGDIVRSAREGLPIYRISGGAGFVWAASFAQGGRGNLRFAAVDASAFYPELTATPLPSETQNSDAQVTALENELTEVRGAKAEADIARQSAERTAEKATARAEAAKRDAQLAETEITKLRLDNTTLNAALEELRSEKAALEAKTHAREFVAYGLIGALTTLVAVGASVFFMRRKGATVAKNQIVAPETEPLHASEHSPITGDLQHSEPSTAKSVLSSSSKVPQAFPNATIAEGQKNSGSPEARSMPSEAPASDKNGASKSRPIRVYRIDPRLLGAR